MKQRCTREYCSILKIGDIAAHGKRMKENNPRSYRTKTKMMFSLKH